MSHPALIVIDVQNDYFPGGDFPLAETDTALQATLTAIAKARAQGIPIVHVQHVAGDRPGAAPFFNRGTAGVDIHPAVLAAAPDAPVIVKTHADSFEQTALHATLQALGVDALILCGMMSHNCVTHTALSRQADAYPDIRVLADASATVTPMLNAIALKALSSRVRVAPVAEAL